MMFTVYTCIILISWFGAKMIVVGSLTTGELMSLLAYCMNILMSLMMLSMVFVMISMSMASMRRIAEVLDEKTDIHNPEHPVYEVTDGSITFKNVDFSYKKDSAEKVLKDINLEIRSGETIGIIGGTGSAKTSLVNLISRLYDVTDGEILVGGKNVKEYDLEVLRNQVSVVLQKNVLFTGSILDISVGETKKRQMKNVSRHVNWPVQMSLSSVSRINIIRILNRAETMCPEVRSRDSVLQEHF